MANFQDRGLSYLDISYITQIHSIAYCTFIRPTSILTRRAAHESV